MKKLLVVFLIVSIWNCSGLDAQDTRITPGLRKNVDGLNSPKIKERVKTEKRLRKDKASEGSDCESSSCEECPVMTAAMESLPKMIFKVGSEETCCHMTATRMAHEEHEKIVYLVGKKRYHESRDAFEALVKQTEMYVKRFVKPTVCKESGATTVAGETCECNESASKYVDTVSTAIQDMKLTYKVGEKEFEKYHDAKRYAKKTHTSGAYVVDGEKYKDEYEARLALAHQKYKAAVQAIQQTKSVANHETGDSLETKSGDSSEEAG